ncbi:MAG: glycosyl hydrolase family 18 protein [Pirellulales bacterium]
MSYRFFYRRLFACALVAAVAFALLSPHTASGQQASISAWDSADFRIWGYIPYWTSSTQIQGFATSGLYSHVSDVLYFGGYRPNSTGQIAAASSTYAAALTTIRSQAQSSGFRLHLSMFEVNGTLGTDPTWESIIANPTYRATFVSQLKTLMLGGAGTADDITGFNFDWERPSSATEWGNYTQLARELRAAFKDPSTPTTNNWEISVCDFGSTDSNWDNTTLFDAKVYDQLMMMVYHIGATSSGTWANTKLALTGQGAAKAFSDDQITIGVGTWGTGGPSTIGLSSIVAANPNLAYDAGTYTGTIGSNTGTWTIESRKQVREKTQLALDRGMPGMFTWTLHYDATNNLGLHRVMQHYAMVKRDIPDLNLDGKVDAADANALANNMGTTRTNTGMATAAQFDAFYLAANWENGDHDGNGFVNQADADWLSGRYTALGVNLPDRLAFSGTFESFSNATGINGRWRAGRGRQNQLIETGNFRQEATNFLTWNGTGAGSSKRSNSFVTIRNQNDTEVTASVNGQPRAMQTDLAAPIDLGQNTETYFTLLVRENTSGLSPTQLNSANRRLSLDFLNSGGSTEFNLAFYGLQQQFAIETPNDGAADNVTGTGFGANATYLLVGKISGNGTGGNTLQASLFPPGSLVANFTDPGFAWMLTAHGSAEYNPQLTGLKILSSADSSFTVSNVWIGNAATMLTPTLTSQGDFNHDGLVDSSDFVAWRSSLGQTGANLWADGNGDNQVNDADLVTWRAHFGSAVTAAALAAGGAVPEPCGVLLATGCAAMFAARTRPRR